MAGYTIWDAMNFNSILKECPGALGRASGRPASAISGGGIVGLVSQFASRRAGLRPTQGDALIDISLEEAAGCKWGVIVMGC